MPTYIRVLSSILMSTYLLTGCLPKTTVVAPPATGDTTAPILTVVTPVTSTSGNSITRYTFSSDEAGTITYTGDCTSATTSAVIGNNTVKFDTLSLGVHSNCTIQVKDAANNISTVLAVNSFTVIKAKPINDTGITLCGDYAYFPYSGTHNNDVVCSMASPAATTTSQGTEIANGLDPVPAGQDAVFGRDSNAATNSDTDGWKGFSYTKLKADGTALAIQNSTWSDVGNEDAGTQWSCVQDNVTGLIWEIKTDDSGLRDKDWTYSWLNSDITKNGGNMGVADGGDNCFSTARCDTEKYVADVNAATLCGASDWRMPFSQELLSLIAKDRANPSVHTAFIPNIVATGNGQGFYSSASSYADGDSFGVWGVHFTYGFETAQGKNDSVYVILVRGGY